MFSKKKHRTMVLVRSFPPTFLDEKLEEIVTEAPAAAAPVAAAAETPGLFIGNVMPLVTSELLGELLSLV
jgi:hypothetical protein